MKTPLYLFGHGLSYASFEYFGLQIDRTEIARGDTPRISVAVTNTSSRDADEVIQLYTHQRFGTSSDPARELKALQRVRLPPHGTRTVHLTLDPVGSLTVS